MNSDTRIRFLFLTAFVERTVLERPGDEISQSHEGSIEYGPGAPAHADVSRLENLERDDCRVHKIPHFMDEETHPFVVTVRGFVRVRLLAFARVHRDGARDGLVQASVEGPEVFRADRRVRLQGQVGNGLTDVTIIVNDLRDGEPLEEQIVSVLAGALVDLQSACLQTRSISTS